MTDPMPEQYFTVFRELFEELATNKQSTKFPDLAAFRMQVGSSFSPDKGLLVVGRATNGWDCSFRIDEVKGTTSPSPEKMLDTLRKRDSYLIKPAQQNDLAKHSAFWQTVRDVLRGLDPDLKDEWANTLCWTNLAKIAPAKKGNPSNDLWNAQVKTCAELLRIEVNALAPARVLVLAGNDWYGGDQPFLKVLGIECDANSTSFVECSVVHKGQTWVFCKHPDRKPRFVDDILGKFKGRTD